jgi:succinate dehydrogenase cytochrome b subunit
MEMTVAHLPRTFVWRRLHSLMGLWLVLFLCEHLFVNSQAALLLGDNAKGFVDAVNAIHNLPYLPVIECLLLGIPILLHGIVGVKYLMTSKFNIWKGDGSKPSLNEYGRNWAYTWQRLTSWVLLIGLILHVAKFRFLDYPDSLNQGTNTYYFVPLVVDKGLYTVARRVGAELYSQEQITEQRKELEERQGEEALVIASKTLPDKTEYDPQQMVILTSAQSYLQKMEWIQMLERQRLKAGGVVAVTKDFGAASLLTVRQTFKSPIYGILYTLFVLAACFHAFNGLWTFCITWGVVLKVVSQKRLLKVSWAVMALLLFLGLAAIWGTYFLNLRV